MHEPDSTTAEFLAASADFADASERVYTLRLGAFALRAAVDTVQMSIQEFERRVAGSAVVQGEGPSSPEFRMARTVEMLAVDPEYLSLMAKVEGLQSDVAQNDAELERWRDHRTLAQRRMDYVIAGRRSDE